MKKRATTQLEQQTSQSKEEIKNNKTITITGNVIARTKPNMDIKTFTYMLPIGETYTIVNTTVSAYGSFYLLNNNTYIPVKGNFKIY